MEIMIPKPPRKMKAVVKLMETCLDEAETCEGCPFRGHVDCGRRLLRESAYYLRMALEKSEAR